MKKMLFLTVFMFLGLLSFSQLSVVGDWVFQGTTPEGTTIKSKFSFMANGDYAIDIMMNGEIEIKGKYILDGDQITVWDVSGIYACPSEMKGKYKLSSAEDTLTATMIEDACEGRGGDITLKRL